VAGYKIVGTSVATAYAAGVVARSLAKAPQPPVRAADVYGMVAEEAVRLSNWDEIEHGRGIVHELA
jgi:hypothetical protein